MSATPTDLRNSRSPDTGVLSVDETDGASLPDLKDVAEIARTQFADMLSAEEGKKDLVIQGDLMSILEHVTPMGFLKKCDTLAELYLSETVFVHTTSAVCGGFP